MGTKVQYTVREPKILSSLVLLYPTWGVGEEYKFEYNTWLLISRPTVL